MFLSSLTVSHYRGFESAQIELPASGVALVVGPNNAGKSALLAALDVVATLKSGERMAREGSAETPQIEATFTLTDEERRALFEDDEAAERWPAPWFRDWRITFQSASISNAFLSQVAVGRADEPLAFAPLARQRMQGPESWVEETLNLKGIIGSYPGGAQWDMRSARSGAGPFDISPPREDLAVFSNLLADWRKGYYHFEALRSAAPRDAPSEGAEFLSPTGADLPEALLHLFTNRDPAWDEIVKAMHELVPDVGELATPVVGNRVEVVFVDPYTSARRNIKDLGTGVEQLLLTVYVGVRGERARFVVIEEPETNLHPAAQRALMRYLTSWSSDRVFLAATHSTVLLDEQFGQEAIYLVDRREGISTVEAEGPDFRNVLSALGVTLSDVMSADRIILVEGPTDAEILRTWFPKLAVSRGVAIAGMGGSDRAWHVDILLGALDELDHFDRKVLLIRDRDELSDEAIRRLEEHEVIRLLSVRELENFLLDHGAVYEALSIRSEEIGSSTRKPGSRQEVADKLKDAADSLKQVVVLKRVVESLPSPRLVGRMDVEQLLARADPLEDLVQLAVSRAKTPTELEQLIRDTWNRADDEINEDWERNWSIIAPGADVLARVWQEYGAHFDKSRDGVLIAQHAASPDELKDLLRQFVGSTLIP